MPKQQMFRNDLSNWVFPSNARRRHAGSTSVSFFYKNKTLSRDSLGAGAHLDVPVSDSHKPPVSSALGIP